MPIFAFFFVFFTLASIGLPGLNGFWSEFLTILGAFASEHLGNRLRSPGGNRSGAGRSLHASHGRPRDLRAAEVPRRRGTRCRPSRTCRASRDARLSEDLNYREIGILVPLALAVVLLGVYPNLIVGPIRGPLEHIMNVHNQKSIGIAAAAAAYEPSRVTMISLFPVLWPELLLVLTASAFSVGPVAKPDPAGPAPVLAAAALGVVFFGMLMSEQSKALSDASPGATSSTLYIYHFAMYVKLIVSGVGVLLVFLAWPVGEDATGNPPWSMATTPVNSSGLCSSPSPVFSSLPAPTTSFSCSSASNWRASRPTSWFRSPARCGRTGSRHQILLSRSDVRRPHAFRVQLPLRNHRPDQARRHRSLISSQGQNGMTSLAAAGRHFSDHRIRIQDRCCTAALYAGDVYQGAATPVTAFLAFVPKTSGMVALIKVLYAITGGTWSLPTCSLTASGAGVLTMSFGNVLALLQFNIKRVLAYSSVAHTGYMLVGITTILAARYYPAIQADALAGVLFYLAAYGIMNVGAFGVLQMLPARHSIHCLPPHPAHRRSRGNLSTISPARAITTSPWAWRWRSAVSA